jgi:hypothetical protein
MPTDLSNPEEMWGNLGKRRPGQWYIRPLPLPWIRRAGASSSRSAIAIALEIWFLAGIKGSTRVELKLTPRALTVSPKICRHGVYGGLKALELAGLISVVRGKGSSRVCGFSWTSAPRRSPHARTAETTRRAGTFQVVTTIFPIC